MSHRPETWIKNGRREFVQLLRDISGWDQSSADQAFDCVFTGLLVWIMGKIPDLPVNSGARLLLSGLGRIDVTLMPRGRRNPQRVAAGLVSPKPITAKVEFHPSETIMREIRRANRVLNPDRQE